MRLFLDACILFPTVLREILLGVAGQGGFVPLYSPRVLEEWARAAGRKGAEAEAIARAEISLMRTDWPTCEVVPADSLEETLSLPDENDIHVLAAAIAGKAEAVVTVNLRDFPGRTLARHGLMVRTPDSVLVELVEEGRVPVAEVVTVVQKRTEQISGREQPLRPLLKRAGLPRLGKALG